MASQWYYRLGKQEQGPVSFAELAGLIRDGTLTEEVLVRQEYAADWVRARNVVGLLRVAGRPAAATTPEESEEGAAFAMEVRTARPEAAGRWGNISRRIGRRGWMAIGAVVFMIVVGGLWSWRLYTREPLPRRQIGPTVVPAYQVRLAAEARRSKVPSIPNLKPGVPLLVPGLEKVQAGWCVSLTADLCTIVYDAMGRGGLHLYMATRPTASGPFGKPQVIRSCASRMSQRPTIAPNAQELIFMQRPADGGLFYCQRLDKSLEFGEPVSWPLPEITRSGKRLVVARFLDSLHVVISAENIKSPPGVQFFVAERANSKEMFGPPKEVSVGKTCGTRACLRPRLLLAYFGTEKGLFVQGRKTDEEPFGWGACLFKPEVCGPVAGPVWISPGDDVAFYCSPGPGKELRESRNIWVIRF